MFWLWPNVCPHYTLLFVHHIHYDFPLVSRYSGGVFTKIWQFDPYSCGWHCWEASGDLPWELLTATQVRQCLSFSSQFVPFSRVRENVIITEGKFGLQQVVLRSAIRHKAKKKQTSPCVVKKGNGSKAQKSLSLLVLQVSRPYLWLCRSSLNSLRGRLCSHKIYVALFATLHRYTLGRSFTVMPAILLHTLTTHQPVPVFQRNWPILAVKKKIDSIKLKWRISRKLLSDIYINAFIGGRQSDIFLILYKYCNGF